VEQRFRGAYCLHHHRPDHGGNTHLWNIGPLQHDNMALHPRRLNFILAAVRTWNITRISLLTS
jgi:hypothetical protein